MDQEKKRRVRSFVRRPGRMTPSQQRAIAGLWPEYGIDFEPKRLDPLTIFGRDAPLVLEIGFGNGETLVAQAVADPERNYLGIEVHEPGIGHCLLRLRAEGCNNVRLIRHDALEVLEHCIADASVERINLYFPDPWPKKRHHKRRLIQPAFLDLAAARLAPGGSLHIATDWQNYAEHIDEAIRGCDRFRIETTREHRGDAPIDRPTTKFERRGLGKGHRIRDWLLRRT